MGKRYHLNIADIFIIIINIAAGRGNYLLFGLLNLKSTLIVCLLTIIIDVVYITFRFGNTPFLKLKIPPSALFFEILLFYNSLHMFIIGKSYRTSFSYFLIVLLFSLIITSQISICQKSNLSITDGIKIISKGYLWLSLISIFGIIISFILLEIFGFHGNQVHVDFLSSHEELGLVHYWSFFTLNSLDSLLRVPFFQDHGILTGLFHEPHILALNVFPCIILLLGFTETLFKRMALIILATLMVLFEGSSMNIIVLAICLLLYFVIHLKMHFIRVILSVALIILAINFYYKIDDSLFLVIAERLNSENQSQVVSRNLLEFAFTPKTLFGSDMLETSFAYGVQSTGDVGYIAFLLNLSFIITYGRNIWRLIQKKDTISESVAFASLYYVLHSAKVGMTMYIQTLPILLIYLQYYILSYGRNSVISKNFKD